VDLIYQIYSVWLYPNDPIFHRPNVIFLSNEEKYHLLNLRDKLYLPSRFITFEVIEKAGGYNPTYQAFHLYWNETQSGINLLEWKYLWYAKNANSEYHCWRIHEHQDQRLIAIRDLKLKQILEL
jgi:hypothetical protein